MSINNIDLITETGEKIIGVKLTNGDTGEIKYIHDSKNNVYDCALPKSIQQNEKGYTFVLSSGENIEADIESILESSRNAYFSL